MFPEGSRMLHDATAQKGARNCGERGPPGGRAHDPGNMKFQRWELGRFFSRWTSWGSFQKADRGGGRSPWRHPLKIINLDFNFWIFYDLIFYSNLNFPMKASTQNNQLWFQFCIQLMMEASSQMIYYFLDFLFDLSLNFPMQASTTTMATLTALMLG